MAQILIGGPPNTPPQILQGKTEEDLGRHIWGTSVEYMSYILQCNPADGWFYNLYSHYQSI